MWAILPLLGNERNWNIIATGFNGFDGTLTLELIHNSIFDISDGDNSQGNELAQTTPAQNENEILVGTEPQINQITRDTPDVENAVGMDTVTWEIQFSENVTFTKNNISINRITDNNITLNRNGATYTIAATGYGLFDGTLTLEIENQDTIVDSANIALNQNSNININERTFVVGTLPKIMNITRETPSGVDAADMQSVSWIVEFSEGVRNFGKDEINVGSNQITVNDVDIDVENVSDSERRVTVNNLGVTDDVLTLTINAGDIEDLSGNRLVDTTPEGTNDNTFNVGARPFVEAITFNTPNNIDAQNMNSVTWNVRFSESVTFTKSDFRFTTDAVQNNDDATLNGSGRDYTIEITGYGQIDGTATLDVFGGTDPSGKLLLASQTPNPNQNIFNIGTSPSVQSVVITSGLTQNEIDNGIGNAKPVTFALEFSEAVVGFGLDDIEIRLNEGTATSASQIVDRNDVTLNELITLNPARYTFKLSGYDAITNKPSDVKFISARIKTNGHNIQDTSGNELNNNSDATSTKYRIKPTVTLTEIQRQNPTGVQLNRATHPNFTWRLVFNRPVSHIPNLGGGSMDVRDFLVTQIPPAGAQASHAGSNGLTFRFCAPSDTVCAAGGSRITTASNTWDVTVTPNASGSNRNNIIDGGTINIALAANANITYFGSGTVGFSIGDLAMLPRSSMTTNDNTYSWRTPPVFNSIARLQTNSNALITPTQNQPIWQLRFSEPVELEKDDIALRFANTNGITIDVDDRIKQPILDGVNLISTQNGQNWAVDLTRYQGFNGRIYISLDPNHNVNADGLKVTGNTNNQLLPVNGDTINFYGFNDSPRVVDIIRINTPPDEDTTTQDAYDDIGTFKWRVVFSEAINEGAQRNVGTDTEAFANLQQVILNNLGNNHRNIVDTKIVKAPQGSVVEPLDAYDVTLKPQTDTSLNDGTLVLRVTPTANLPVDEVTPFTRLVNEPPLFENQNSYQYASAPRLTAITRGGGEDVVGNAVTWTLVFSEAVSEPTVDDLTITAAGITNLDYNATITRISASEYTVNVIVNTPYQGSKTLSLEVKDNNSITEIATLGKALHSSRPTAETFNLNVPPVVLSINRHSPTNESVTDVSQVQWIITFSEPVARLATGVAQGISNNEISKNINEGTLSVEHTHSTNTAIVTLNNYNGFDGAVSIRMNHQLNSIVGTDSTGGFSARALAVTQPANDNAQQFNINTRPVPTVTRTTTNDNGNINTNNPTLVWEVNYNENVGYNANAYSIPNAPSRVQIIPEKISDTQHRITANNIGIFDGDITLVVSESLITDAAGNNTKPLVADDTRYTINARPEINSIARVTNLNNGKVTEGTIQWRITFNEEVKGLKTSNTQINLTNNRAGQNNPAVNIATVNPANANTLSEVWTITTNNFSQYEGEVTLSLLNINEILDAADNQLNDATPTSSTNEVTISVDNRRPVISSITRDGGSNTVTNANSVTWNITFDEIVNNFSKEEINVTGSNIVAGDISVGGSGTDYSVTVTNLAAVDVEITLNILEGDIDDQHDNKLDATHTPTPNDNTFNTRTRPILETITRMSPVTTLNAIANYDPTDPATNVSEITWEVIFSENVSNVSANNFTLTLEHYSDNTTPTISSVTGSGTTYQVTVSGLGQFDGTISLVAVNPNAITDNAGAELENTIPTVTNNNRFEFDRAPEFVTFTRIDPENAIGENSVRWRATFTENVRNFVNKADFSIGLQPNDENTRSDIQFNFPTDNLTNEQNYIVELTNFGNYDGVITVTLNPAHDIRDDTSDDLIGTLPAGENSYIVGTLPAIESITRSTPTTLSAVGRPEVIWDVRFTEIVENVGVGNFEIIEADNIVHETINIAPNGPAREYQISVSGYGDYDGNVTLELVEAGIDIQDLRDNKLIYNPIIGNSNISPNNNRFTLGTAPTINSLARTTPVDKNAQNAQSVTWTIDFSEPVTIAADTFSVRREDGTNITATLNPASGTHSQFTIIATGYENYNGDIELVIDNERNIKDTNDNELDSPTLPPNANTFTVDRVKPNATAIRRTAPTSQNAIGETEVTWTVEFSENVNALTANDFNIAGLGSLSANVGGSDDTYTITVNGVNTFDGELVLTLNESITDISGNEINIRIPNTNENSFAFNRLPRITNLARTTPVRAGTTDDAMRNGTLTWNISFSEVMQNFEANRLKVRFNPTKTGGNTILEVAPQTSGQAQQDYIITVSGFINYDGEISVVMKSQAELGSLAPIQDTNNNILPFDSLENEGTNSYQSDTELPLVRTITPTNQTRVNGLPINIQWEITFSEIVTDFTHLDLEIEREDSEPHTIQLNVIETSPTDTYTAEATNLPSPYDGNVRLRIRSTTDAKDLAGNALVPQGISSTHNIDTNTVKIDGLTRTTPNDEENAKGMEFVEWNINFSEDVDNVDGTDFIINGNPTLATQPNIEVRRSSNPAQTNIYIIKVSNITDYEGTITLELNSNNDIDESAASNIKLPDTDLNAFDNTFTIDTLKPTITSLARKTPNNDDNIINADNVEWEITFSEDVGNSFTNADLRIMELQNANIIVPPNGLTRTIEVRGYDGYQGTLTLQLAQNHEIRDVTGTLIRGNQLDTAYQFTSDNTFRVDRKNPEIIQPLTRLSPTTQNAGSATELQWRIRFSEKVVNFENAVEIINADNINGEIISISPQSSAEEFTVTVNGYSNYDGVIALKIKDNHNVTDELMNPLTETRLENGDFNVGTRASGINRFIRLNPQILDARNATTVQWQIEFDEPVELNGADFNITTSNNQPLTNARITTPTPNPSTTTHNTIYNVNVTGYGEINDTITLNIDKTGVTDVDGNPVTGQLSTGINTFKIDTEKPTIVNATRVAPANNAQNLQQVQWKIEFSENVNRNGQPISRDNHPFIVNNAQVNDIGFDQNVYTISAMPNTNIDGSVTIDLDRQHNITDEAGNPLEGGLTIQGEAGFIIDNTAPFIVEIRRDNPQRENVATGVNQLQWSITFSEAVLGFNETDIIITTNPTFNTTHTLSEDQNFVQNNTRWIATLNNIPPDYVGQIELAIQTTGHGIHDEANIQMAEGDNFRQPNINENIFNVQLQVSITVEQAQKTIMNYISGRAKQIFNAEPELGRNKKLNANADKNGFNLLYNNQYKHENNEYWVNININRSEENDQKSETNIYSLGYNHKVDNNTNIGLITQIDEINTTSKIQNDDILLSGLGWLIGPYLKTNVAGNVFLNMRAAWGKSENKLKFNNQKYNIFNTTRFFIKGKIEGQTKLGKWTLNPHISGQSISEKQKEFKTNDQNNVPEQSYSLWRISVGPKFSREATYKDLILKSIVDFIAIAEKETQGNNESNSNTKVQIKKGFIINNNLGTSIHFNGYKDLYNNEGGNAYGMQFNFNLDF